MARQRRWSIAALGYKSIKDATSRHTERLMQLRNKYPANVNIWAGKINAQACT